MRDELADAARDLDGVEALGKLHPDAVDLHVEQRRVGGRDIVVVRIFHGSLVRNYRRSYAGSLGPGAEFQAPIRIRARGRSAGARGRRGSGRRRRCWYRARTGRQWGTGERHGAKQGKDAFSWIFHEVFGFTWLVMLAKVKHARVAFCRVGICFLLGFGRNCGVGLELVLELVDEALHRPRAGFAEGADGPARDVVGHVFQQADIARLPLPLASRSVIFFIQSEPSRHGVHWPHDSCA